MFYCKIIKKKIQRIAIITPLFFIALFFTVYTLHTHQATGSTADNVSGYAWSGTIGWISFNCTDPGTCGLDYGVSIDGGTGDFSGYAWSENVGWIDFAPIGPYPEVPNHGARLESDDTVTGWAKALSADGLGWDGWIKLTDTAAPAYGVTLNTGTNEFEGFAWGGDVVGWISFNGTNYAVVYSPPNIPPTAKIDDPDVIDYPEGMNINFLGHGTDTDGSIVAAEWRLYVGAVGDCSVGPVLPSGFTAPNSYFIKNDLPIGTHNICFKVEDDRGDWSNPPEVITIKIEEQTACSNGLDDDTDGYIDNFVGNEDPACYDVSSSTNPIYHWEYDDESADPECSNGIDDDFDELIDLGDPGCHIDKDLAEEFNKYDDSENTCGDDLCDVGETYLNCPQDCSFTWVEF